MLHCKQAVAILWLFAAYKLIYSYVLRYTRMLKKHIQKNQSKHILTPTVKAVGKKLNKKGLIHTKRPKVNLNKSKNFKRKQLSLKDLKKKLHLWDSLIEISHKMLMVLNQVQYLYNYFVLSNKCYQTHTQLIIVKTCVQCRVSNYMVCTLAIKQNAINCKFFFFLFSLVIKFLLI